MQNNNVNVINNKRHSERILLSYNCNLDCNYCYQKNKPKNNLDNNILLKRLNDLKNKLDNNEINKLYLSLFGGEPTLNREGIELIYETFKDYNNVYYSIISNGLLVNEEYINLFKKFNNFEEFTVSIDGRAYGNRERCNETLTEKTINNIKLLIENNFKVELYMTIGTYNIDSIIDDIKYFIDEVGVSIITPSFIGCEREQDEDFKITLAQKKEFIEGLYPYYKQHESNFRINDSFCVNYLEEIYEETAMRGDVSEDKPLRYRPTDLWWVLQPNGYVYALINTLGANVESELQFQIDDKMDLSKVYVHKLINYNLENPEEIIVHELDELIKISDKFSSRPKFYNLDTVYILMDEKCNLKCKYCYEFKKDNMRIKEDTIDNILKYLNDNYIYKTLILFGGEPTLNEDGCIKVLKDAPKHVTVSMSTNGVNVSDRLLKAFREREKSYVQVSLDGTYNTMKERLGENTEHIYNNIVQNAHRYSEAMDRDGKRSSMCFHATITKDNVKNLYENIKFLLELDLCYTINTTPNINTVWSEVDYFIYETQMRLLIDYIENVYYKKKGKIPFIRPITTNRIGVITDCQSPYACSAGVTNIMFNSKGEIYPCARLYTNFQDRFKIGDISTGEKFNRNNFLNVDMNKENPETCGKCKVAGCIRCYSANLELNGNIYQCNPYQCRIMQINEKINKEFMERFKDRFPNTGR